MQRTPEWYQARCGKITASRFKDIVTKPRSKGKTWSETAISYAYDIVGERATGDPAGQFTSRATEWGILHEPAARETYSFLSGNVVDEVGFVTHPDLPDVGASSDGIIEDDGIIEIKCPETPREHIRTLAPREMPDEHMAQVQGNLWVAGRKWCDFISYHPKFPSTKSRMCIVRVNRDDDFIEELEERVRMFRHFVLELQGACLGIGRAVET